MGLDSPLGEHDKRVSDERDKVRSAYLLINVTRSQVSWLFSAFTLRKGTLYGYVSHWRRSDRGGGRGKPPCICGRGEGVGGRHLMGSALMGTNDREEEY